MVSGLTLVITLSEETTWKLTLMANNRIESENLSRGCTFPRCVTGVYHFSFITRMAKVWTGLLPVYLYGQ